MILSVLAPFSYLKANPKLPLPFFSYSSRFVRMYLHTSNKTSENWQQITRVLSMFIEGMLKRAPNDTVLARFFKFTGGTSQVHLRHHCDAPGSKNHVNRRLQHRSSQVGRLHMRTRLYSSTEALPQIWMWDPHLERFFPHPPP